MIMDYGEFYSNQCKNYYIAVAKKKVFVVVVRCCCFGWFLFRMLFQFNSIRMQSNLFDWNSTIQIQRKREKNTQLKLKPKVVIKRIFMIVVKMFWIRILCCIETGASTCVIICFLSLRNLFMQNVELVLEQIQWKWNEINYLQINAYLSGPCFRIDFVIYFILILHRSFVRSQMVAYSIHLSSKINAVGVVFLICEFLVVD